MAALLGPRGSGAVIASRPLFGWLWPGVKAFFKGTNPTATKHARAALIGEVRVYNELSPLIADLMPALYAIFQLNDWHVLLLEDLGPNRDEKPTKARTLPQTPQGYADLAQLLLQPGYTPAQILVVMEATGPYWVELATYLQGAGFVLSVINLKQAHNFAGAIVLKLRRSGPD